MADEFPLDFSEPVARVRNYIPDTEQLADPLHPEVPASFLFSDDEIQSFIDDETDFGKLAITKWRLKRAAASAMIAMANTENLILKKLKTQDQTTDGPAMAKELLASAQALYARADAEEHRSSEGLLVVDIPTHAAPTHVYPWWY